jgi:5-methyltetrahydropteroyltriglutamate--homocysteine methyltransferase
VAIPSEPIGSIPRPPALIEAARAFRAGRIAEAELLSQYDCAIQDTIARFEATGSKVVTDGEQAKESFATYPIQGLTNVAADGMPIPFADGHIRQFPRLSGGPFKYRTPADVYLETAQRYAHVPVKQAVISPSALSLLYPQRAIPGYSREEYLDALLQEQEGEIRRCLQKGAHAVQIDFTEGRLSIKLDPTGRLLRSFIDLNNLLLERFSAEERKRIGVHTCHGADRNSSHSAGVDYAELLPSLFELKAGNFYMQLASEPDRKRVLQMVREYKKSHQRVFVGVSTCWNGAWRRLRRSETACSRRPSTLCSINWVPQTTAVLRLSAMTFQGPGIWPSRRFVPASRARSWPRKHSALSRADSRRAGLSSNGKAAGLKINDAG